MSRRYFGTDGIRGKAGQHPITGEFAFQLGNAAGHILKQKAVSRPFVIIGQDTRASSDMLSYAIGSGLQSAGMNTLYVSVTPTPAVAYLCRYYQATAGVMISASHNAYKDNGIKFFSNKGEKIDDETEIAIEKRLSETTYYASSDKLGHTLACHKPEMPYIEFCKSILTAKNYDLSQFKLVIDCANGSFSNIAPWLLHQLNAKVIVTCAQPDGVNINQNCGAVSTQHLAYEVLNHRADLGMAFDGDGDRLIMIDSEGNVVDGDDILYLLAFDKYQNNELSGGVVGTLMTNYGIEMALKTLNIPLERTKVGDRYVLEKMKTLGWCLGGETSGHIIARDTHTTGDGLITALLVLKAIMNKGKVSLQSQLAYVQKTPQVLSNVKIGHPVTTEMLNRIEPAIKDMENYLQNKGRIVIRPSGTEPVIRVMAEAFNEQDARYVTDRLVKAVKSEFNSS